MTYIVKLKKEIERTVVVDANSDEEADKLLREGKYNFSVEHVKTPDVYIGYDYVSCNSSNVVITSEQDLKNYFDTNSIEKMVFKYTDCGCCYRATEDFVGIAGYAEDSDAECSEHKLYFPFTIEEWDAVLEEADREGCELYDEIHGDNCL